MIIFQNRDVKIYIYKSFTVISQIHMLNALLIFLPLTLQWYHRGLMLDLPLQALSVEFLFRFHVKMNLVYQWRTILDGSIQEVLRVEVATLYLYHSVLEAGHCLMAGWLVVVVMMMILLISSKTWGKANHTHRKRRKEIV